MARPADLAELDAAFRRVLASPGADAIARAVVAGSRRRGARPWHEGACLVLAEAVETWLGAGVRYAVIDGPPGTHLVHVAVRAAGSAIDGGGVRAADLLLHELATAVGLPASALRVELGTGTWPSGRASTSMTTRAPGSRVG